MITCWVSHHLCTGPLPCAVAAALAAYAAQRKKGGRDMAAKKKVASRPVVEAPVVPKSVGTILVKASKAPIHGGYWWGRHANDVNAPVPHEVVQAYTNQGGKLVAYWKATYGQGGTDVSLMEWFGPLPIAVVGGK